MPNTPNTLNRPFVVGLTGGIACGKSSICSLFKKLNVPIVDADIVAREVVKVGSPLLKVLTSRFGEDVLQADGSLNRRKLREIAFDKSKPENLEDLNKIMAPAIQGELKRQIEEKQSAYVIVAIPLLFEHHLEHLVDRILVVDVKEDLQLKRLCRRDSINETLAKSIIASQVTREERLKKADDLIESDDSPLDKKLNVVVKLHNMYLDFAK